ncbi:hypothetical protein ACIP5O_36230, partial [Streptomyces sp. NPDC088915]
MGSTVLEDQDVAYEVELRFRPGGPAILSVWAKAETADAKFTEWLGSYGRDEAVLTLTATSRQCLQSGLMGDHVVMVRRHELTDVEWEALSG